MNYIIKLYRKILSPALRGKIYDHFWRRTWRRIVSFCQNSEDRKALRIWLLSPFLPRTVENRLYAFMGIHGTMHWPYPFSLPYLTMQVDCRLDSRWGMYYVMHEGRKLYFPDAYGWRKCINVYRNLLTEQDPESPHRYVPDYQRLQGKTLIDAGCAEAIFTLTVIEYIQRAYLFECSEFWWKALSATFEPWKDKITLVRKYVSDKDDEQNITLDTFFKDKDTGSLFLKMDIEGFEIPALHGAEETFRRSPDIDFAICTYHRPNDVTDIPQLLKSYLPTVQLEQTNGYLFYKGTFSRVIVRRA